MPLTILEKTIKRRDYMRENPKPGELWRHFEGNEYVIITAEAVNTGTEELMVVCKSKEGSTYVCPLSIFMNPVYVAKNVRI